MTVKIKINGPIIDSQDQWIYDLIGIEATSPKAVLDALPDNSEEVELTINSYGGLVDSGNEIYTGLRSYNGPVSVNVIMAGSAASVIAMAGDTVRMSPVGQIMIHNSAMMAAGDYHDMDKASEILQKVNDSISNAYVVKTGMTKDKVLELMDKETWMTAEEAKELGFADEIMFESEERPEMVANAASSLLPRKVINKVKEMHQKETTTNSAMPNIDELANQITENVLQRLNSTENNIKKTNEKKPQEVNESSFGRFLF